MDMKMIFSAALGINEPWFVSDVRFNVENKRLDIDLNFKPGSKFEVSGIGSFGAYDTVQKSWRHLNFFEHECYLNARVPRVKDDNGTLHTVMPGWSGLSNGFTLLFEALILQLSMSMPIAKVSELLKVSSGKIWRMLDNYVNSALSMNDYSEVKVVGMDETSIAKGHDYITLFVDLIKRRTISITRGKGSNTVKYFASDLAVHGGDSANIEEVSCDMSPAFIRGVIDNLPNAKITFDKFHVLKIINEAVDKVRRAEAADNPVLRGLRYIFLKNNSNLTAKQVTQKRSIETMGLKSWRAMLIREGFQDIYQARTKQDFETLLKRWYFWATHSKLDPIKQAAKMVKNHWDGIVRWKDSQINNGILEGLNSVLQAAKRKARGYKFDHFRTIAFLITGKLSFNQLNYALPT
jgi:transposase